MKTGTKILGISATVAMLAAASIFGTLAYLTDNDKAENTFTVGKVEIKLDEKDVKATTEDAERVKKNEYHIVPGDKIEKDPTVTVEEGSEDCYVRMKVTLNKQAALDEIYKNHKKTADLTKIFGGYDKDKWVYVGAPKDGDTRTYEFRYYQVVSAANGEVTLPALFETVDIPDFFDNDDMASLAAVEATDENEDGEAGFTINIVAEAIQSANFADADEAWEAFDAQ